MSYCDAFPRNQVDDTETGVSHRLAPPRTEAQSLQDVQEEDTEREHVNGSMVVKSSSDAHLNTSSGMWVICCSSSSGIKNYWAAYRVINIKAYRPCQGRPNTAVRAAGLISGL